MDKLKEDVAADGGDSKAKNVAADVGGSFKSLADINPWRTKGSFADAWGMSRQAS